MQIHADIRTASYIGRSFFSKGAVHVLDSSLRSFKKGIKQSGFVLGPRKLWLRSKTF